LIYETDLVKKADHLYNFCATGIAVRDFFFNGGKADAAFGELANGSQEMIACLDIGNTSKHFKLTRSRGGAPWPTWLGPWSWMKPNAVNSRASNAPDPDRLE
jgi:hypothetical protein